MQENQISRNKNDLRTVLMQTLDKILFNGPGATASFLRAVEHPVTRCLFAGWFAHELVFSGLSWPTLDKPFWLDVGNNSLSHDKDPLQTALRLDSRIWLNYEPKTGNQSRTEWLPCLC